MTQHQNNKHTEREREREREGEREREREGEREGGREGGRERGREGERERERERWYTTRSQTQLKMYTSRLSAATPTDFDIKLRTCPCIERETPYLQPTHEKVRTPAKINCFRDSVSRTEWSKQTSQLNITHVHIYTFLNTGRVSFKGGGGQLAPTWNFFAPPWKFNLY